MDLSQFFQQLFQGNNPILLLLAFFLFKDQIFAIFTPKPKPVEPVPVPPVVPVPVPAPTPDRPIIDAIVKDVLPVLLPVLIQLIKSETTKLAAEQPK